MGDHSLFTGSQSSRVAASSTDEDVDNDKLWQDFQSCAEAVTKLYQDTNWRQLQNSASATTQLYKSALEIRRKAFEKGVAAGKAALAKELLAKMSGKYDVNSIMDYLYRQMGYRSDEPAKSSHRPVNAESLNAIMMFQEVLDSPNVTASPNRSDLHSFLHSQVQRRKRQRSPPSPTSLYKKSKRF